MKVAYNNDWGGFPGKDDQPRHDPALIADVESGKLGKGVRIAEIPDDSHYIISDYDGRETVYYSKSPIDRFR